MKLTKNISQKQMAITGIFISLLLVILIGYFFVFKYMKSVVIANGMLINNRVEFETKLIKEEKFSKISKNIIQIESDIKKIDTAFVDENKKLEFITMFESLADKHNTDMEMDINFEKDTSKDKSIPLSLVLRGDFPNLMSLLVSIENLDFYVNIESINLSASKAYSSKASALNSLPGSNSLTMTILAKTYWN